LRRRSRTVSPAHELQRLRPRQQQGRGPRQSALRHGAGWRRMRRCDHERSAAFHVETPRSIAPPGTKRRTLPGSVEPSICQGPIPGVRYHRGVARGWSCSECGCSAATASRRRARRGLGPLRSWAHTCSPECKASRKRAYDHRLWKAAGRRAPTEPDHGPGWHCSECGADLEQANRKRARLALGPMHSAWQRFCSPTCAAARRARRYRERWANAITDRGTGARARGR
jgi:hypothetical protein